MLTNNRKTALNYRDLLNGCINRMFVSDDPAEVIRMYEYAQQYLSNIYSYAEKRVNGDCDE